ncbi:hypothetical protein JVU11DRAFT_4539 [Chiua virens]|nr:hypothetical protein JVU11DRAFT_4539 [Chiua virens]
MRRHNESPTGIQSCLIVESGRELAWEWHRRRRDTDKEAILVLFAKVGGPYHTGILYHASMALSTIYCSPLLLLSTLQSITLQRSISYIPTFERCVFGHDVMAG